MTIQVVRESDGGYWLVSGSVSVLLGGAEQAHTWLARHDGHKTSGRAASGDLLEGYYWLPSHVNLLG